VQRGVGEVVEGRGNEGEETRDEEREGVEAEEEVQVCVRAGVEA